MHNQLVQEASRLALRVTILFRLFYFSVQVAGRLFVDFVGVLVFVQIGCEDEGLVEVLVEGKEG